MNRFLIIFFTAICLIGLVAVLWRIFSRRRELPCPSCLRWMVELDNPFTRINRAGFIVEHLRIEPGMIVLDAGCGPGCLTIPIAEKTGTEARIVAMDVQEGMLSRVRQKVEAKNLTNVDFLNAGLGSGKLEKNRFDRALLVTVLGEIPEREKALNEVFDALIPGGILEIVETVFDPHYQRRTTVCRLAEEAGFIKKESFGNILAYAMLFQKPQSRNEYNV